MTQLIEEAIITNSLKTTIEPQLTQSSPDLHPPTRPCISSKATLRSPSLPCWFTMSVSPNQPKSISEAYTTTVDLITLSGHINHTSSTAILVDSGASCNFISTAFASRAGINQWQLARRIDVRTASGRVIPCSTAAPDTHISLPGYQGRHNFVIIADLDAYDVVLGRTFLKQSRAVVDHSTDAITWHPSPLATALSASHPELGTHDTRLSNNPWYPIEPPDEPDVQSPACTINASPAAVSHTATAGPSRRPSSYICTCNYSTFEHRQCISDVIPSTSVETFIRLCPIICYTI
jgi:hypothetical protein